MNQPTYNYYMYIQLLAIFSDEAGSAGSPQVFLLHLFWRLVEQFFLWAGCPFCHPAISIEALNGTQRHNPNQWLGFILSSTTTRLLTEEALLCTGSQTPVATKQHIEVKT